MSSNASLNVQQWQCTRSRGCVAQVEGLMALLRERVKLELAAQEQLLRIRGMLEPLLTAGAAGFGG